MATHKAVIVIGAGTMGRGIAQLFAQSGYDVYLNDAIPKALDEGVGFIGKMLDRAAEKGAIKADQAQDSRKRLHAIRSIADAPACPLIIEAATEKVDLKSEILKSVQSKLTDDGILATNTSSISITQLAAATKNPDRFIGMHFFNPVPLMKLVEVVKGLATSDETVRKTFAYAESVGKTPVQCNDHPGFVSNRILMPMINEAIFCLQDGVAEPAAIDEIMKLGMNHPMGPLALADLVGLDVCLFILEVLHRDLGEDRYRPCPLLRKMVAAARLGRKTKQGFFRYD
jgi:3-hydroxybutyryl-CoA dehydrogenase